MDKIEIGKELRSVNNQIRRYFDNRTNKKAVDSATDTNGWIIGFIAGRAGQDVYQRDLEEAFGVTRSTASKVVNLMVQKGFIDRQTVKHDARLRKLVLTPKAMEIHEMMLEDRKLFEEQVVKGFTQEEIETLYSYLQRIKNNVKID